MIDAEYRLREAYYTALDGNVTFAANPVPVYGGYYSDATYPYIRLGDYTARDEGDKQVFGVRATLEVFIVHKYQGHSGGYDDISTISDDVLQIIRTRTPLSMTGSVRMITSTLSGKNTDAQPVDGGLLYVSRLVFEHILREE